MRRLLLALVVALIVSGCDSGPAPRPPQPPRIEDLAKAPVDLTKRCPKLHHKPLYAPEGRLPAGALFVRLCTGWVSKQYAEVDVFLHSYDDPGDVLRLRVDELAERANALKPPPPPSPGVRTYCSDVGGTPLEFWFGYPGGRAAVVRWEVGGCGYVHMGRGAGLRSGGELRDAFSYALAEQRGSRRAHLALRPPRCNPSAQPLTALKASTLPPLATATYCLLDDQGRWRAARVPDVLVREVNREAVRGDQRADCATNTYAQLRALTTYGDRVDLYADDCRWSLPQAFVQGDGEPSGWWTPSRSLVHRLASLRLGPPHPQRKPDGTIVR